MIAHGFVLFGGDFRGFGLLLGLGDRVDDIVSKHYPRQQHDAGGRGAVDTCRPAEAAVELFA